MAETKAGHCWQCGRQGGCSSGGLTRLVGAAHLQAVASTCDPCQYLPKGAALLEGGHGSWDVQ